MKKKMDCFTLPSKSTEERIWEAAKQVFLEKGFDGATSRDIATAAGINIALTNYYFRSKEKLFLNIFAEMFQLFFTGMVEILNRPISLREKIAALIEHDFQLMKENPCLALFIMNEIHRNPERIADSFGIMKQVHQTLFEEQLQVEINRGTIRPINGNQLIPMIFCNIQFLFISKPMHMKMWQMTEDQFEEFAIKQKNLVIDMITNFLYEPQKV
ncbi:TetR/AcrR family transcriptional regulator [Larkinella sp. VNQ87]|uniref:TetR/AcrR family transcriptional regulator n=1 Tax=Larkinella sp. VNQ87 TaxID=3400921 RepID=UPI003C084386